MSVTKSMSRAKNIFYWPATLNDVEQYIANCRTCELYRSVNKNNKSIPRSITRLPFEKVAVDILSYGGSDYLTKAGRLK